MMPDPRWLSAEALAGLGELGADDGAVWLQVVEELREMGGDPPFRDCLGLAAAGEAQLLADALEELPTWAACRWPTALECLDLKDCLLMMVMGRTYQAALRAGKN